MLLSELLTGQVLIGSDVSEDVIASVVSAMYEGSDEGL